MADRVHSLIPWRDSDEGPSTAEIIGVPVMMRPTAGEDLNLLVKFGNACDIVEGTVGQTIKW